MSLDSWTGVKPGSFESAEVFARPALKSRQFLAATGVVAVFAALDIIVLIRLYHRVRWFALLWILLVLATVTGNWLRVMVVHRRLHELYIVADQKIASQGSPLNMALRAASTLCYWGALGAAATGIAGLMTLFFVLKYLK